MKKLKTLLRLIDVVQLVLGLALLLAPSFFLASMGLSTPSADINYMLGMLSARFLAYGVGMFVIVIIISPKVFKIYGPNRPQRRSFCTSNPHLESQLA